MRRLFQKMHQFIQISHMYVCKLVRVWPHNTHIEIFSYAATHTHTFNMIWKNISQAGSKHGATNMPILKFTYAM